MLRLRTLLLAFIVVLFSSSFGSVLAAPVDYGDELKDAPDTAPSISFTDVPDSHWAYSYIADMVGKKVISGYPDNKFRPGNTISRAEFATIIIKAAGLQAQKVNYSSFSDVKVTDWYSPYIETAKDYLTGYRTANGQYIFNPTAPAVREDITVAIVKLKGYDVSRLANRSIIEAMFTDYDGISESAKDYVAIAVEYGLVSGYANETFRPQNSVTRAEAAALLWRAFMYGNDNKDIGGGTSQPATPTAPVNPAGEQPGNQPQNPDQSSNQPAKFSVDTLVGGIGQGDVDGPISKAKINRVDSMAVDKDNNIYWLDKDKGKVRKFHNSSGTVETFRTIDDSFDWDYSDEEKNFTRIENTKLVPWLLAYNSVNDKLYLIANVMENQFLYSKSVFEISPTVQIATHDFAYMQAPKFMIFDNNEIIYGGSSSINSGGKSLILKGQVGAEAEIIADSSDGTGVNLSLPDSYSATITSPTDAVLSNGNLFIFDTEVRRLSKIQLFPRKVETIATFNNRSFEFVTSNAGKFYVSSGTTIYELTTDGKLTTFLDGKDLTYNDGKQIQQVTRLSFDSKGNIIVYDDGNKAFRRINL